MGLLDVGELEILIVDCTELVGHSTRVCFLFRHVRDGDGDDRYTGGLARDATIKSAQRWVISGGCPKSTPASWATLYACRLLRKHSGGQMSPVCTEAIFAFVLYRCPLPSR